MTATAAQSVHTTAASEVVFNKKRRVTPRKVGQYIAAFVVFVVWTFPVYWMVQSSFLTTNQMRGVNPTFFPLPGTTMNYGKILQPGSTFYGAIKMSLIVTLMCLVLALITGFFAALAVSRFRFLGRRGLIVMILVIQMIPGEAMMISVLSILLGWNMTNTFYGLGLVYTASVIPFTVWTLRGFVNGVPAELEESARVDGCTQFGAFMRVTFPLMAPGLISTGIFAFIQAWNEFVTALVVMNKEFAYTLPIWLRHFMDAKAGTDWGQVMAGSVLISIPVVIFFMIVQGRMVGGVTAGAVKG